MSIRFSTISKRAMGGSSDNIRQPGASGHTLGARISLIAAGFRGACSDDAWALD
jgi:hypothetical protein